MAKIVATFDTQEKTCEVTLDGKPVDNLSSIQMYQMYGTDDFTMGMTRRISNDDEGMTVLEQTMARNSKEVQDAIKNGKDLVEREPGLFVVSPKTKLEEDIVNFLKTNAQAKVNRGL